MIALPIQIPIPIALSWFESLMPLVILAVLAMVALLLLAWWSERLDRRTRDPQMDDVWAQHERDKRQAERWQALRESDGREEGEGRQERGSS